MKTGMRLATAVVLVAGARIACAQFSPPTFDQLDKDGNGALSKDEVAAFFAGLQRGGGGPQGQGGGGFDPDRIFSRWDANGDGSVSKEEWDSRPRGRGPQGGGGGN